MTSLSIVVIGYVWPEPCSSAAGENMYNLLGALTDKGWNTIFLSAASDSAHKADLQQINVESQSIALNCSSFDTLIESIDPHIVIFDRFMIEEQFSWRVKKACPNALRVLNTEDLHSLRHTRQQALKKSSGSHSEATDPMVLREVAAILRCDLTLIISKPEFDLLVTRYGVSAQQLLYLPLLISTCDLQPPPFSERHGFVFIGNFRHAPNWDALLQLKEQLWPAIRAKMPGAQLSVYGAYPAKKVTNLHNPAQGFMVEGWVDNARTAVSKHRVMLAPIRFGAGVKGKLVTAMQCATPSVTTESGAEGIDHTNHWPGVISNEIKTMADAAVLLHDDAQLWQAASDKSSAVLRRQFDTPDHQYQLTLHLENLVTQLSAHRSTLIMQQLLWHETLRSTQYMSQWIEAKNRQI